MGGGGGKDGGSAREACARAGDENRKSKIGKRGKTKKLSVSIVGACNVWRVRSRPAKHAGCRAPRLPDTQHAGTRVPDEQRAGTGRASG